MSARLEYKGGGLTAWDGYETVGREVAKRAGREAEEGWALVSHAVVTTLRTESVAGVRFGYEVSLVFARRLDWEPG